VLVLPRCSPNISTATTPSQTFGEFFKLSEVLTQLCVWEEVKRLEALVEARDAKAFRAATPSLHHVTHLLLTF